MMLQPYNFFLIIAQKDEISKGKAQLPVGSCAQCVLNGYFAILRKIHVRTIQTMIATPKGMAYRNATLAGAL